MVTRHDIVEFIRANPNCNTTALSGHFGFNVNQAATRMKQLFDQGYVTRHSIGVNSYGHPLYVYNAHANVEGKTKRERLHIVQPAQTKTYDKPISDQSLDSLVGEFVQSFASTLATAIVGQLKPRLEEELKRALPAALPSPAITQQDPHKPVEVIQKARLPRIGVTGLLPQQAGMIQQEFCDTFDITFWNDRNGDGQGSLKAMGIGCEVVFYHVNHASHTTENALKAVGAKIIHVNGGMSQMRDALTKYYVEQAA